MAGLWLSCECEEEEGGFEVVPRNLEVATMTLGSFSTLVKREMGRGDKSGEVALLIAEQGVYGALLKGVE